MSRPTVTVISPCFNEQEALPLYLKAVEETLLARKDVNYEILLIDDGSDDGTWDIIEKTCRNSSRHRGLRLSRNFGSHTAATAGFDIAEGDAVAIMPVDLQEPPDAIIEFVERWRKGAEIVWGKRRSRSDKWWRALVSRLFTTIVRRFALPAGSKFSTGSFLLIDRKVVTCLRQFREHNRVVFALVAWTGFTQDVVEYDRRARIAGYSNWRFSQMIRTMYDTLIGFSRVVPRTITIVGLICAIIGFLAGFVLIVLLIIAPPLVPGWSSIIILLTLLFGVNFLLLGTMSEYLFRIHLDATGRPLYFIARDTAVLTKGESSAQRQE